MNIQRTLLLKNTGQRNNALINNAIKNNEIPKRYKRHNGYGAYIVELKKVDKKYYWVYIERCVEISDNLNLDKRKNSTSKNRPPILYKKFSQIKKDSRGIARLVSFSQKDLL